MVKEQMIVEDLAALDKISEERILDELQFRMEKGDSYTYVGDVLLSLNSNEIPAKYPRSVSFLKFQITVSNFPCFFYYYFLFKDSQQISLQITFRQCTTRSGCCR